MQLELNRLNRLFSFEDIVEKYGGTPKFWESLRPYLPVWQHHDGKPIYLESQVDDFLRALQHRWSVPTATPAVVTTPEQPVTEEFLTIAEAQERFLGGKRSKEWWYKKARSGKLVAHDADGSRGAIHRDRAASCRKWVGNRKSCRIFGPFLSDLSQKPDA